MTVQKLSRKQILWIEQYQDYWGQFLSHLGVTFFGNQSTNPIGKGAGVVQAVIDRVWDVVLRETRGTLDLNRFVMLAGRIAGIQFGMHQRQTGAEVDQDFPTEASHMFEAAFRVAYEEVLQSGTRSRLIVPGGGVNA